MDENFLNSLLPNNHHELMFPYVLDFTQHFSSHVLQEAALAAARSLEVNSANPHGVTSQAKPKRTVRKRRTKTKSTTAAVSVAVNGDMTPPLSPSTTTTSSESSSLSTLASLSSMSPLFNLASAASSCQLEPSALPHEPLPGGDNEQFIYHQLFPAASNDNTNNPSSPPSSAIDGRPFQCSYCDRTFKRLYNLRSHVKIHLDDRPFECSQCCKRFAR